METFYLVKYCMVNNLIALKFDRKDGQEPFTFEGEPVGVALIDFWTWYLSDLVSNATRGVLAEYIVAKALELTDSTRVEWDAIDLRTKKGLKIEVKSSAYIQSWKQDKESVIQFDIKEADGWDAKTNEYSGEKKRNSDVYIFCILAHRDQNSIDPLNLDQWDFYVLETKVLNEQLESQQTMRISTLLKLNPTKCRYNELKQAIDEIESKYCGDSVCPC